MIKLPNTLSFRLTCWYAGTFLFFLVLALVLSYFALGAILEHRIDEDLLEDIEEFKEFYFSGGLPAVIKEIDRESAQENAEVVFLQIIDRSGRLLYSSELSSWPGLKINTALTSSLSNIDSTPLLETQSMQNWEHPARLAYGVISDKHVLQIGESIEETIDLLELILMIFAAMMFLVVPVAGLIGWRISQKAVYAITEVSNAALDIRSGQFDRQIDTQAYGIEIETLVSTFNAMARRIQKLIFEMREMTDNIAHDLRSPIARIRVMSETILGNEDLPEKVERVASDTIIECDRLIRLINTTLDVAEAEADVVTESSEKVDLSEIAEEMCELYQPLAEQKKIKLSCNIQLDGRIPGRRQSLQRLFVNLIDNALKYTNAEGAVTILLTHNDKSLILTFSDTGIGIPEKDKHLVFDRFYRCDDSRSEEGCGLGLSFVAAVVKAHGGEIAIDTQLDVGTTISITFAS